MDRKPWLMSLLILFLFTGTAFAQTSDDSPSEAEQECKERYERDMAEAEEDYQDAQQEDQRPSDDASQDGSNESKSSEEAKEDYENDQADAERRYEECLADAREDAADESDDEADDRRDEREDEGSLDLPASYSGRHVAFDVTRDGVANYSVDGAPILASVSTHRPVGWEEVEVEGASIKLEGHSAEAKVSDTPTGVFRFESEDDTPIQVTFPEGVTASLRGPDDRRGFDRHHVLLQGDGFQAILSTDDGHRLDAQNGTLVSHDEIRLVVVEAPGLERKDPATVDGIVDGRIAVEVDVPRDAAARAAQHGDVNITLETVDGDLVATVEGHGEGKTVLFNLEPGSYTGLDDLTILFDGEPIGLADNLADVMHVSTAEAEESIAEYLILVGAQETQVLVQVPHFSVHTIELDGAAVGSAGSSATATIAIVVGGGAAIVFVATTLIGRRRGD